MWLYKSIVSLLAHTKHMHVDVIHSQTIDRDACLLQISLYKSIKFNTITLIIAIVILHCVKPTIHKLITCKSVTLPHIHTCHNTVGPQCLSCWLNYLFWYLIKLNLSNELVPGQSGTDGVYCSGSLGWPVVERHKHLPQFGSSNGFHSLLPVVFTEAILDKERAWKKQITLPHTGLLYQCSMPTVLPVECINVCVCGGGHSQYNVWSRHGIIVTWNLRMT